MGLRDTLRRISGRSNAPEEQAGFVFLHHIDDDGTNLLVEPAHFEELRRGRGSARLLDQFVLLSILAEEGLAEELPNGFSLPTSTITGLGDEEAEVLGFLPRFDGDFDLKISGPTTASTFDVRLRVVVSEHPEPWEREGSTLKVGTGKYFRLTTPALQVIQSVEEFSRIPKAQRSRATNVDLVSRLQDARRESVERERAANERAFRLDLGHLEKFTTEVPDEVGLIVEQLDDGSMHVIPDIGVDAEQLMSRTQQLLPGRDDAVISVGDRLIVLKPRQRAGVEEVLRKPRVPREQVGEFFKNPAAFYDSDLVNVDQRFGVRVKGVGVIVPLDFSEEASSGIDWFTGDGTLLPPSMLLADVESTSELDVLEERLEIAWERGDAAMLVGDSAYSIADEDGLRDRIERLRSVLEEEERRAATGSGKAPEKAVSVGVIVDDADETSIHDLARTRHSPSVDLTGLRRSPFAHQREGIEWLVDLMGKSLNGEMDAADRVHGALLADDMGLGKTFMTLVALRGFLRKQEQELGDPLPTLAVLPLSLIENWESEIAQTFDEPPFTDIVVLQTARDLADFKIRGRGRETKASEGAIDETGMLKDDAIRFSLRVGQRFGDARLDQPGRLVLTTYAGLRDYQLSLAQVSWGAVIFDEAQNIKNPEVLVTAAAKGLNARFKLLATGTPIENSLRDLWCLMDTAQPGLLGTYSTFKQPWASSEALSRPDHGTKLRGHIGPFMLRRVKEDHLPGLPSKTIHSGVPGAGVQHEVALAVHMPELQRTEYDSYLAAFSNEGGRRMTPLEALQGLRSVSLHPRRSAHTDALEGWATESARIMATLAVLDRIKQQNEKAIVFAIDKKVQRKLATLLTERYKMLVSVVNGDTNAVSRGSGETRKTLIEGFEAVEGFNVIIMSPLAVGVGLTVTGANHAIHLERHWNPAKEAQATDRVYRIGQTRPVHVYMPIATHPLVESFDVHLDQLLRGKTQLKDAVIVPESVEAEMASALGLKNETA